MEGLFQREKEEIRITELPLRIWTSNYKEFLESIEDIEEFQEFHTTKKVNFLLKPSSNWSELDDQQV